MTSSASGAQFDFNVLFLIAFPVVLAVWVYLAYALIVWRGSRAGAVEPEGGAKARGHLGIQVGWIVSTTVIVLGVFVFGTVELIAPAGAGGGEGPSPDLDPHVARRAARPGHRPAVGVHLPLPDLRWVRDHPR